MHAREMGSPLGEGGEDDEGGGGGGVNVINAMFAMGFDMLAGESNIEAESSTRVNASERHAHSFVY